MVRTYKVKDLVSWFEWSSIRPSYPSGGCPIQWGLGLTRGQGTYLQWAYLGDILYCVTSGYPKPYGQQLRKSRASGPVNAGPVLVLKPLSLRFGNVLGVLNFSLEASRGSRNSPQSPQYYRASVVNVLRPELLGRTKI